MKNVEVDLFVSCYGRVKIETYDVVILPWSATEFHNVHLPYLMDCIISNDSAVGAGLIAEVRI